MSRLSVAVLFGFLVTRTTVSLAGDSPPAVPPEVPSSSRITLDDARRRALSASPELQALAAEVRAAEGASRQARALANPELAVELEDFSASGSLDVTRQSTFSISQGVEWPGKRSARVEAVRLGQEVAARDLARGRKDLLAEVDRAFAILLGAQERATLAEQSAGTAREVSQVVSALVAAGEASPVEDSRALGDQALAEVDLANALRDVDVARRDLARLLGEDVPSFAAAAGTLVDSVALPDRAAALAELANLPDLTRWDAEAARQEALVTLARRQALPDVDLRVGTRSYSGLEGSSYVAGLTLPIPLFTRFSGAQAEAAARQEQARHHRRADEVRVRTELLAAWETLSRAVDEARALRDEVLPRASSVYEALNEGYRRGKFRLLDLLEARRTLAATRLRYVDALVRLNVADADLRRLIPDPTDAENGGQR